MDIGDMRVYDDDVADIEERKAIQEIDGGFSR